MVGSCRWTFSVNDIFISHHRYFCVDCFGWSYTSMLYGLDSHLNLPIHVPMRCETLQDDSTSRVGAWVLVPCPVDLPLTHYAAATGLVSYGAMSEMTSASIEQLRDLWGTNVLDVPVPSFLSMLGAQMLSPLVIFQLFCSALWLLDEYWSVTLWTLGTTTESCILTRTVSRWKVRR